MSNSYKIILFLICLLCFTSCSINKFIPEDKTLFDETTIEFKDTESPIRKKETLESELKEDIYIEPNSKFLGLWKTRLWIYYKFKDNHEKGIRKYLFTNFSESPIYLQDLDTILLENIVSKGMQDHGYFHSEISVSHKSEKKHATVNFNIAPGSVTIIDKINRPEPTNPVDSLIFNYKGFWLELNEPYLLNDFEEERTRLASYIRSKGYFEFDVNDIYYLIDTSNLKNSVSVIMKTKFPKGDTLHRKFHIKEVNIFVNNSLFPADSSNIKKYSYEYKGYTIYDPAKYIDKRTIERNLLIAKGSVFNVSDYELTLGRLLNLSIFQYVNIEYKKRGIDSLQVNIFLTPKLNSGLQLDFEANTSDRSFLGSNISANFFNDNTLNKAEKLSVGLKFGSEFQYINSNFSFSILNLNAETKYEVPRLLSPIKVPKFRTKVSPKTILSLEEDFQLWLQYFTKNSINANYGYEWQRKPLETFTFNPIFVNVINVFSTTAEFDSIVNNRPLLGLSFQDNIIVGSLFSFQKNAKQTRNFGNYVNYRASIETAGNTSSLIANLISDSSDPDIFGLPIAQYIKFDFDIRFTRGFNENSSLVTRLSSGIVKAYGSSQIAPFTKQYFIGGPTTLRGFQYRSVGPGAYQGGSQQGFINPIDQAGDLRILYNIEYRFTIFNIFKGATFIDAGNVWLLDSDSTRPEAAFKFTEFYKQIALNSGFGVRLDFGYFAFRIDLGIPLYKPFNPTGNRWIWQENPSSFNDFYTNSMVLSGGIGYPF